MDSISVLVRLSILCAIACSAGPSTSPPQTDKPTPREQPAPTAEELAAAAYQKLAARPVFPYKPDDRAAAAASLFLKACELGNPPACWQTAYAARTWFPTALEKIAANCHRGHTLSCRVLLEDPVWKSFPPESARDHCRRGIGVLCMSGREDDVAARDMACRLRSWEGCDKKEAETEVDKLEQAAIDWECQKLRNSNACLFAARASLENLGDHESFETIPEGLKRAVDLMVGDCIQGVISECDFVDTYFDLLPGSSPASVPPKYWAAIEKNCLFRPEKCSRLAARYLDGGKRGDEATLAYERACQASADKCLDLVEHYERRGEANRARELLEYTCNTRKYQGACDVLLGKRKDAVTIAAERSCQRSADNCLRLVRHYESRGEANRARELLEYTCKKRKHQGACELLERSSDSSPSEPSPSE